MIRVYLDNSYIEGNENKTSILVESEGLSLNSISYHDAEKLTAFMMPPHSLDTLIADMPVIEVITVTEELTARNISTSGSIVAGDLINNICKFFNTDFKSLGSIIERDFS